MNGMLRYNGMAVYESIQATQPVITLSSKVMVTDEFREKCNLFYIEMFGVRPCAYTINGSTIVMHPDLVKKLRAAQLESV